MNNKRIEAYINLYWNVEVTHEIIERSRFIYEKIMKNSTGGELDGEKHVVWIEDGEDSENLLFDNLIKYKLYIVNAEPNLDNAKDYETSFQELLENDEKFNMFCAYWDK